MNFTEKKKMRWQDYMEALEEESRKIQVFYRELPLCLELVNQAIENCRQQICFSGSEEEPVLEEFIPLKRSCSSSQEQSDRLINDQIGKKVDWLRSVQLWNQTPDTSSPKEVIEPKKRVGAFHPFHKETTSTTTAEIKKTTTLPSSVPLVSTSSTTDNNERRRNEKEGQLRRKSRRCWSPELHRNFIQALQQLGGSHGATPKQIRELMKVDGLTNDEVKSHLQKYRLHTRRPCPTIQNKGNPQPTQFVFVGGIWVPPTGDIALEANKGVYVPVSVSPQFTLASYSQQQQKQLHSKERTRSSQEEKSSVGDDNDHSNCLTSSSSIHTTMASPTF